MTAMTWPSRDWFASLDRMDFNAYALSPSIINSEKPVSMAKL